MDLRAQDEGDREMTSVIVGVEQQLRGGHLADACGCRRKLRVRHGADKRLPLRRLHGHDTLARPTVGSDLLISELAPYDGGRAGQVVADLHTVDIERRGARQK